MAGISCQGKVVFMAPTKPLVAQQIQACYKIMGIPQVNRLTTELIFDEHCAQNDMAEMTGNVIVKKREDLWSSKRVFFLTPQVIEPTTFGKYL